MQVDIQFQNPKLDHMAASYQQKFADLKREHPDFFTNVFFARFGNEPHLEFDYFADVIRSSRRRRPKADALIFTRLETRTSEAPQLSYLVPSYCGMPSLTVTYVPSPIETNEKSHRYSLKSEHMDFEELKEPEEKSTSAAASAVELDDTGANLLAGELGELCEAPEFFVSLYNSFSLDQLIEKEKTRPKEDQKRLVDYETMRRLGATRHFKEAPALDALSALGRRFPNFGGAIERILGAAALSHLSQGPFSFPPLLLLGPSGIGKTYFASELANLAGVAYQFISMESVQSSWVLTGHNAGWASAEIGRIGDCLIHSETANPLFVIDEVDKAMQGNYNPIAPLYALLESHTAAKFREEFLSIELNVSHANWILTANDTKTIPAPLLSRMTVVEVPAPTRAESARIAKQIYQDLVGGEVWGGKFETMPSDALIEGLLKHPPRVMRSTLLEGFGRAAIARRNRVEPKDLKLPEKTKTPITLASALLH